MTLAGTVQPAPGRHEPGLVANRRSLLVLLSAIRLVHASYMGNGACWGDGVVPGYDEGIGNAATSVVLPAVWLSLPVELLRTIVDLVAPRDLMSALWACNVRDIALAGYAPVLQVILVDGRYSCRRRGGAEDGRWSRRNEGGPWER